MLSDLPERLEEQWEALVVGAGPAGSTVARLLAERGIAVLLVDRSEFPREKVCGCCLNGAVLQALGQSGRGRSPLEMGAVSLTSFELVGYDRRVRVPLPRGCVLSRSRLDSGLVANARMEGVRFLENHVAVLGEEVDAGWRVELQDKSGGASRQIRAGVVVCADGLHGGFLKRHAVFSPVVSPNSRIGLGLIVDGAGAELEIGRIRMVVDPDGYVGMVRLEDGRVDVAAAIERDALQKAAPADLLSAILARHGCLKELAIGGKIRGTPPLSRRRRARAGRRLFLIGDAAGYVEPFTGEGIAWAISSAVVAAPLVVRACRDWSPELIQEWESLYRRCIGRRQSIVRLLAAVLKRPLLSRALLSIAWALPSLTQPVVTRINRSVAER